MRKEINGSKSRLDELKRGSEVDLFSQVDVKVDGMGTLQTIKRRPIMFLGNLMR